MAKNLKHCTVDNGSVPSPARSRGALVEIVGTPFSAAKDFSTDKIADIRESMANKFKFTWVLSDNLKKLGLVEGEAISRALERMRADEEAIMRYAEKKVIEPFDRLYAKSPETAKGIDDVGNLASSLEINVFDPTGEKYKSVTDLVEIDGVKMTKYDAYLQARKALENLRKMKNGEEAVQVYKNLLDAYQYYRKQLLEAIVKAYKDRNGEGNLADNETSPEVFDYISKTREAFREAAQNEGYLPFLRQGKYVVNVTTPSIDEKTPSEILESRFFKSKSEARKYAQALRDRGVPNAQINEFKKTDFDKFLYGMSGRGPINAFFDKLKPQLAALQPNPNLTPSEQAAEKARLDQLKQKIHQMSLSLFPETSVRKNLIASRKGTEGYMRDALQVFAIMSGRNASQIARIKHSGQIDNAFAEIRKKQPSLSPDDQEKVSNITEELLSRVYRINNMPGLADRYANLANQLGFTWFLGLNPASAFINVTQVPVVTLPFLGARYGGAAVTELMRAYKTVGTFMAKNERIFKEGSISERLDDLIELDAKTLKDQYGLTRDEVLMLRELDMLGRLRSGIQIYDVSSVAELGGEYAGSVSNAMHKVQKISGYMFQKAELINREVTALAAYRLARDKATRGATKPMDFKNAWEFAGKAIEQTQGAYTREQAPSLFLSPPLRVALMFKKFPMHMAAVYVRLFKDMADNSLTTAERKVALTQFTGMMGIMAAMAGVAGMPFYYILRDVMNQVFGDEDDPYSFDYELRKFLIQQLGNDAGNMMFRGVLGESGLDIGSRISYEASYLLGGTEQLPFLGGVLGLRDVRSGENAEDKFKNIMVEMLGPGAGIVTGLFRGYEDIKQGEVLRGVEKMLPAFARNPLKAGRFATEGVLTARGDPIIEDITTYETIMQAFGFSPQRLSSQYKVNNQIKDLQREIEARRNSLMDQYFKALKAGDRTLLEEIRFEINQFNEANPQPGLRITPDGLRKSRAKRESISRETRAGIYLPESIRTRYPEFPELGDEE